MKKKCACLQRILNSQLKCPKKSCFLFYEDAMYVVKSKVLYPSQFLVDPDEIWYQSITTQRALAHQISSWSEEKWQRYGTWSISQGRRGPSNRVSKMDLPMAGGHCFWPRKIILGYVVAHCIYQKSYYHPLFTICLVTARPQRRSKWSILQCSTVFITKMTSTV